MDLKFYQMLEHIENRLSNIEGNITRMDEKLDLSLAIQRNHLIRIKHGEELSDDMVLLGKPYNDLTPEKAYDIFKNPDLDYILIDVSAANFRAPTQLEGAIKMPFEELVKRVNEIRSRTTPILIISEEGIRSILACEALIKRGYYNINNVSGGHKFWPGHRLKQVGRTA